MNVLLEPNQVGKSISDHRLGAAKQSRHRMSPLFVIFVAAAAVRLVLWLNFRNAPLNVWDEHDYNALGKTLAATGEFAFSPGGEPTSLRPPLYPALLAVVYKVFGSENLAAVRFLQMVMSLITGGLLYLLGRAVLHPRAVVWLTALYCFYPSLLGYNNLLLTEVLFTQLLIGTCGLTVLAFQQDSIAAALAAGLCLGLSALTRSVVWLAPPLLAGFLFLAIRATFGRRLFAALALLIGFSVVVVPWAVRNTRLQQTFIAIDTMGGRNFMMGNYRYTPLHRSWDAISIQGDQSWISEVLVANPEPGKTQGQIDKLALRHGLEFVQAHPGLTLQRDLVKFIDFWGLERELVAGAGRGHFGRQSSAVVLALALLICGSYVTVFFLGIFGVVCEPLADRRGTWLLLGVIIYVCGLHTLTFAHSRYHLPVIPLVIVFAANALANSRSIWSQRGNARFALASSICGMFALGWFWQFLAIDGELLSEVLRGVK